MDLRNASSMRARRIPLLLLLAVVWTTAPSAERMGYSPEEFSGRRQRLAKMLQRGTLVLFGASAPMPGLRFRQDHDFYYLTGNESLNAVLVMDVPSGAAHVFMPKLSAAEIRYEGPNWLDEADAAQKYGFASVQPLTALHEFLARRRSIAGSEILWTRLSERDYVSQGRLDTAIQTARRLSNPFAQHPGEDAARAAALRERFPFYQLQDVVPRLDRLRLIKTPREIEILRYNGRVSAEAIRRAIQATSPGRFEYELEAEATHWLFKHGMQAAAYPAIVGSGPMGNRWHYEDNGRRMNAGELVVMDYGGSLDYLTIDITRTWPVSGQFTDAQLKAYRTALEAQKAIIAAIRPGVTRQAVRTIAEDVFRNNGFDPRYAYVGHYVGMSVHDVGDWDLPFEAGMVMAIEPIIDMPDQELHVRVEDTILVAPNGAEVLTSAVPKEVEELLALLRARR
jgi:Xaa-Pro aminopeptidase